MICSYFVIKIDIWNENYFFGMAHHLIYLMHVLKTFKRDRDKYMIEIREGTAPRTAIHPSLGSAHTRLAGTIRAIARSCLWVNTINRHTVATPFMLPSMFSSYQRQNNTWAMNNSCKTKTRQNKFFIHNINPLTWSTQWNYHATLY